MIDLETVHSTDGTTRFKRAVAVLLGLIAVTAAMLGAVQMQRSQDETRSSVRAARLTADLAAGLPVQGTVAALAFGAVRDALVLASEGTSRRLVGLQRQDALSQALGAADEAAGNRLLTIAQALTAPPAADAGLPAYELRLMTTDLGALQQEVQEQNRVVDVDVAAASAASSAAVAGLSMLALAGVLVGLASVLGADRAGRITLVAAWLATLVAAGLLVSAVL